jgi:hypothetical protein
VGEANGFSSTFPGSLGSDASASSLALKLGRGLDIGLSHHFAARLLQADWLRTQFSNGTTNVQSGIQLGTGVVMKF